MNVTELDTLIRSAATDFVAAVFASRWRGREREAISLFAFGYLQRQCAPGTILSDPTQIAIEACVPGVTGRNPKERVNKDLVIWPRPAMSFWDVDWKPGCEPLAVMEWKVYRPQTKPPSPSAHDRTWLRDFSAGRTGFIGYAVWLDLAQRSHRFVADRFENGQVDEGWLVL